MIGLRRTREPMLAPGVSIFVRLASEEEGGSALQPAVVVERLDAVCTVELVEPGDAPPMPGDEITLYFDLKGRFSEQRAKVERCVDEPTRCVVGVLLLDEPTPSENRQSFRVSTATGGIVASFNKGKDCPVVDVSFTGFAVVSDRKYEVGTSVSVSIRYENATHAGSAVIKSASPVFPDKTRYGLHVPAERGPNSLQKGLQAIASSIQRRQLQRLARGA